MKRKITILTIISLIAIGTLSGIEYYLVKTAYDYKVQEFRKEIQRKAGKITADFSYTDSLISEMDTLYGKLRKEYLKNEIDSANIIKQVKENELQHFITAHIEKELKKTFEGENVGFAQTLDQFILFSPENQVGDTILNFEESNINTKIFGTLNTLDNTFKTRRNTGKVTGDGLRDYFTVHSFFISIRNWELIVLRRMSLILIAAIGSILTVIIIFIYTLRSLIRQKKLTDIQTDFINNITHEFKTPLATLGLATATLKKQEQASNVFNSTLNTIERQNNRLQKLLDQIMENSLVGKGIELQKEEVEDSQYFNNLVNDFRLSVTEKEIDIKYRQSSTPDRIRIDKFHFTTALLNILENAVKYGSDQIKILIETHKNDPLYIVSISDNGPGIPKESQALVFDKFYRASEGNVHTVKGLGLGLYYTKLIVEAHDGSIELDSGEEKGTTFKISIPK
ncbi:sensor histidine kinase [Leptobacterium flavescens]|uniref:histidine kinase n=1 Tax=Leptobacterium flavescens TaxID=472055 RepID=A0A6P0UP37_9FLAO|nr:HAMP domain-containing sensor histidine kinase [Leptobacterium flavescens]NER14935.1 sensor histidine kinase [Leptobacterium flavescens]